MTSEYRGFVMAAFINVCDQMWVIMCGDRFTIKLIRFIITALPVIASCALQSQIAVTSYCEQLLFFYFCPDAGIYYSAKSRGDNGKIE